MKHIKVLGTGCASCQITTEIIRKIAQAKGVKINLEKVESLQDIMAYKIISTPGVVIDGKVVHAGGIPKKSKVEQWLN